MKQPPIAKLYEAYSVIADNRIQQLDSTHWQIISSNAAQHYTVVGNATSQTFSSNDNATYWQGYPGYPILAAWLKLNLLSVNSDILPAFQKINWHARNDAVHNHYDAAITQFLNEQSPTTATLIQQVMTATMQQLATFDYTIKRNRAAKK